MALSEDQKAMLRLLAQRGEAGYEDLAALLGIGVGEVHARATEAAVQLESEGIPAPPIPAPPNEAATAKPQPPAAKPAAPDAPAPEAPAADRSPAASAPKAAAARPAPPRPSLPRPSGLKLPESRGARFAIAANVVVVLAIILIVLLAGGEDSGSDDSAGRPAGGTVSELPVASGKDVTKAILSPADGGSGSGVAIFGRSKDSLVLQIAAEGLETTSKGESYTIWLSQSPEMMLPLAATKVTGNGQIAASVEIPAEVLGYLANETFTEIALTRTSDDRLAAALKAATSKKAAPAYTGTAVLRGPITGPIVGAAKRADGN